MGTLHGNEEQLRQIHEESGGIYSFSLYPRETEEPGLSDLLSMKCEIIHDIFFRDSEDPLPLTMPGTYYIDCEVEESLEDGVKYALHAMYQVKGDSKSVFYREVFFKFD